MTISSTTRKAGPYTGTGSQYAFSFAFKVFINTDLYVVQADLSQIETVQTLTSQYTVTLNADQNASPGGTVNMIVAPPAGYLLTMTSVVPLTQATDITNNSGFYPAVIVNALDKLTILSQQIKGLMDRTILLPLSTSVNSLTLPIPVAGRALKWNPTETGLINTSGDPDISTSAAAASAASASASASSALSSWTSFNSEYLGAFATAPTVNNYGGVIATGTLYYNTTTPLLMVYNGGWQNAAVTGVQVGKVIAVALIFGL